MIFPETVVSTAAWIEEGQPAAEVAALNTSPDCAFDSTIVADCRLVLSASVAETSVSTTATAAPAVV